MKHLNLKKGKRIVDWLQIVVNENERSRPLTSRSAFTDCAKEMIYQVKRLEHFNTAIGPEY